jgi:hypothetical protein
MSVVIVATDRRLITDTEWDEVRALIPSPRTGPQEAHAVSRLLFYWRTCDAMAVLSRNRL